MAAHRDDDGKVVAGVWWESLDPDHAVPACEAAVRDYPDVLRFKYQYARARDKAADYDNAVSLYKELAQSGHVVAQVSLGRMYQDGEGVPKDDAQAVKWYRLAAEQGYRAGQMSLGLMYHVGQGVSQDDTEAVSWIRKADDQGYGPAHDFLCLLSPNRTGLAQRTPIVLILSVFVTAVFVLWFSRAPSSYVRRHWRGDLSLSCSFWVNCILLYLVFGSVLAWLPGNYFTLPTATAISFTVFALSVAVLPWQVVGCWRSASFDTRFPGDALWARVVQVMMIVGIFAVANRLPPLTAQYVMVAEVEDNGYEITVLGNGREIEVCGALVAGIADEVQNYLDNSSDVEVIRLNSIGGWRREGHQLLDLIEQRKLITYSATGCASACTIAFVGGHIRVLNENARLGFHAGSYVRTPVEKWPGELDIAERTLDQLVFASRGVDKDFVTLISETPPGQMWFPSIDELVQAGFITRVSDGHEFAASSREL